MFRFLFTYLIVEQRSTFVLRCTWGEMLLNLDLTIRLFFTKMNPDYIWVSALAWYFVRILIKLKRVGPTLYSDPRGRLCESND